MTHWRRSSQVTTPDYRVEPSRRQERMQNSFDKNIEGRPGKLLISLAGLAGPPGSDGWLFLGGLIMGRGDG